MADYSKTTNFKQKDTLATGNTNKIVKGSEVDVEFNNISTAIATKVDQVSISANNILDADGSGGIADSGITVSSVSAAITSAKSIAIATSGTDTYTATYGITSYETNRIYLMDFDNANTSTTPTLNLDSVGAKTIKNVDGSAVAAGALTGVKYLWYDGTDLLLLSGYAPPDLQTFTASGTWTKPAGLTAVEVIVTGGGGSGQPDRAGVNQTVPSVGGGAGGTSIKRIAAASLGATETVTVGAGGSNGTGGTSSFGAHCSATGGSAGTNTTSSGNGGDGGLGADGDLNLYGGDGDNCQEQVYGNTAASDDGTGGASYWGGGPSTDKGSASTAISRGAYGCGGSGSAGRGGVVVVREFF